MNASPSFSPRQLAELYVGRAHDELSTQFLEVLRFFSARFPGTVDVPLQRFLDAFAANFLHYFSQVDYVPSRAHSMEFIRHNLTIANLVALSSLQTTDPFLEIVRHQPNNLVKVLTLYSARNRVQFDRQQLFAADPQLAADWYLAYAGIFHGGLLRPEVCANLREHYSFQPPVFLASDRITDIYYGASYVEGESDREIKAAVNRWVRAQLGNLEVRNRPNPRKIAVLSCLWWEGQSSHRIVSPYLEALKDYDLTLFHAPLTGRPPDTAHFREVKELAFRDGVLDLGPLRDNDFMVAFFPDVGMTTFSVWLANVRIAPIQIAATGHSVSTWGAEIDYYLSGANVEIPDHPERFYSERLLLLPGCGAVHCPLDYQPTEAARTAAEVTLNCAWSAQKVSAHLVRLLREIVRRSEKPLRFRLFVGGSLSRHASSAPFVRELTAQLAPAVVEILPHLNYGQYMAKMEEGDFSIDAYPFAGCNTVADSLCVRKPIVTYEGERWYNRIGPQMLRLVGQPELIAGSDQQYVDLVLRLIHDEAFRAACTEHLRTVDLHASIWNRTETGYFRQAIEYLIANQERLRMDRERTPIRIRE